MGITTIIKGYRHCTKNVQLITKAFVRDEEVGCFLNKKRLRLIYRAGNENYYYKKYNLGDKTYEYREKKTLANFID